MYGRGMRRATAAAGLIVAALGLVACGNEDGGTPAGNAVSSPSTTPSASPSVLPGESTGTSAGPTPERSVPEPVKTPTMAPTPTTQPASVRLRTSMLLTGSEVAKADPGRGWIATTASADPICGPSSTRGNGVRGSLNRNFTTELDASGGQWVTRYDDVRAAKAAYAKIVATIKSCKALDPAPTHARKLTENRTLPLGDATAILRWYDYPLPSDPGSEPGGFPYAVTREGTVVSVLAFREMGDGVKPANFEKLARAAGARLG
ncbi:hypothetical protein [Kribbella sp. CA-247076]|uniref:hypothetical protein n=1 Tax=Kribbella sp. CA-247076 TaxID=3239941 RepID=UPI003D914F10